VVGDNYAVDIEAAQAMGYGCVLISDKAIPGILTIDNLEKLGNLDAGHTQT
jgi:ribonucleotide monophosphatase NagD (HAD superfamily)